MGLIKAGIGALGGTLADQWKEFFRCEALPNDVLMGKREKRVHLQRFRNCPECGDSFDDGDVIG